MRAQALLSVVQPAVAVRVLAQHVGKRYTEDTQDVAVRAPAAACLPHSSFLTNLKDYQTTEGGKKGMPIRVRLAPSRCAADVRRHAVLLMCALPAAQLL